MKKKTKIFNIFVVVLTLCLAAVLAFLIANKFKKQNSPTVSAEEYSINIEAVEPSEVDVESEKEYLMDATWEDMRFILSGVEYKLPLDVSELEEHGWFGFEDETIEPGERKYFTAFYGDSEISGYTLNTSDYPKTQHECKIVEITFCWSNGIFPQNIEIMKSTIDDVYEKYGEPLSEDTEMFRYATYENVDWEGGFEALIDINRPGISFYYDGEGVIVCVHLYCGKLAEEAE
ncbi:MAG: hypothetical protein IKH13_03035 [Clostridia bacterium]|nr:hypothetical protein [Clostridia bacterium]